MVQINIQPQHSGTNHCTTTAQWHESLYNHSTVVHIIAQPQHSGTKHCTTIAQWYKSLYNHSILAQLIVQPQHSGTNHRTTRAQWHKPLYNHSTVAQIIIQPQHGGTNHCTTIAQWHKSLQNHNNTINLDKKGKKILHFIKTTQCYAHRQNILIVLHDSFVKSVVTVGLTCCREPYLLSGTLLAVGNLTCCREPYLLSGTLLAVGNLSVKYRDKLSSICAILEDRGIPVWSNYTSEEHCKRQRKSYLTPPTSYTTCTTTFSPLKGGK